MSKVTAYTENTAPSSDDMLYIVDSAAGATPTGKKVQVESILSAITSAAGGGGSTGSSGAMLTINGTPALSWLAKSASGAVLTYSTAGTTGPVWTKTDPGTVMVGSTLNAPTMLAAPASGAILSYSTAGTSGAAWSIPTSAAILTTNSAAGLTWHAAGSTGRYLRVGATAGEIKWSNPSKYVAITGFASGGTLATGPCGYAQIPPEVDGMNLTYVSGFHASTAASNGKTEISFVRMRAGTSAVMLTSAVEVDSGAICSSASASQAVIDTTNDDVATGDIIELHVKVIPSASAPKGITGQLGFSLP